MRGSSFLKKIHAKMYAGSWKNPFFSDPKAKERAYERSRILLYAALTGACVGSLISLAYWYGTQPRFAIGQIETYGMRSVPNVRLSQVAFEKARECTYMSIPCRYTWNIRHAAIQEELTRRFPLESIEITFEEKKAVINVKESVTTLPLRIGEEIWFASSSGALLQRATQEEIHAGILIPHEVYTEIDVSAVLQKGESGVQVASPQIFHIIQEYKSMFQSHGVLIDRFVLTRDAGKILAETKEGYRILFSPWQSAEVQGERMAHVLAEQAPQSYIDIRFGERVYIK